MEESIREILAFIIACFVGWVVGRARGADAELKERVAKLERDQLDDRVTNSGYRIVVIETRSGLERLTRSFEMLVQTVDRLARR